MGIGVVAGLHGFPITELKSIVKPDDYPFILIHIIPVGGAFNPSGRQAFLTYINSSILKPDTLK